MARVGICRQGEASKKRTRAAITTAPEVEPEPASVTPAPSQKESAMPQLKIDHWHPFAELFPLLTGEEWESFCASIRRSRGNREPVIYRRLPDGRFQGIDGRNRYRACEETGQRCRMEEAADLETEEEVRQYIIDKNLRRRHMTAEQRRPFVADLKEEGKSNRAIAAALNVSEATVRNDLKVSGAQGCAPEKVTGTDGKTYPATLPKQPAPTPPRQPGDSILPELRLKVLPRRWAEVERLTQVQQAALLARLREAMGFDRALAEVVVQVSGADESGHCPICGCAFEDPKELTHQCPPGFAVKPTPARPEQLVFDWPAYDAAFGIIEDQVDLLARVTPGPAGAKLGALLAEVRQLVNELAGRE